MKTNENWASREPGRAAVLLKAYCQSVKAAATAAHHGNAVDAQLHANIANALLKAL